MSYEMQLYSCVYTQANHEFAFKLEFHNSISILASQP